MLTCHLAGLCPHPTASPQSPHCQMPGSCLYPIPWENSVCKSVFQNYTTCLQKSAIQAHCTIQGTFGFKQVFQNNSGKNTRVSVND